MTGVAARTSLPSPELWRAQLDASRGAIRVEVAAHTWPELRRRFREISFQTRSLFDGPIDQHPLPQLADRSLNLSKLAFHELNRFDTEPEQCAAPTLVAELLDQNRKLLDEVTAQQRLLTDLHATAEPLHAWADELMHGTGVSARAWLQGAEDFAASVRQSVDQIPLFPLAGLHCDQSLTRTGWKRAEWYVQAWSTARLAAHVGNALLDCDPDGVRWLTAAALMQDIGLWLPDRPRGRERRAQEQMQQQHPAIGAGLLAGVPECPTAVALLVGTHHERLDGSGEPQRLSGDKLPRRAQVFGLMARFCELAHSAECHAAASSQGESLPLAAGLVLWREVRRGAFQEQLAQTLLDRIEPGLSDRIATAFAKRAHLFVDARHSLPAPHRPAALPSRPVPEPMYLRRQRGAGTRRVARVSKPFVPFLSRRERDE